MTGGASGLLRTLAGQARGLAALTVTYSLAEGATVGLLAPWLEALLAGRTAQAWTWLAALAACVAVGWLARGAAELRAPLLSSRLRRALYDSVGSHVVGLPLGWFTPARAAQLQRLLGPGVDVSVRAVTLAQSVLGSVLTPVVVAAFLLVYDWPTGLAALVVTPIVPLAFALARRLTDRADAETDAAVTEASARLLEFAGAQPVLRATGYGGTGRTLLTEALHGQYRASRRALWRAMPGEHLGEITVQLAFTAVVVAGLARVGDTGLQPARALVVLILGVQLLRPIASIVAAASSVRVCRAALRRLDAVLTAQPLPEPAESQPMGAPAIQCRNVSFGYGDSPVLRELDLHVPAGTTTALVGPSGTGKSTVIQLIARFHDVTEGQVLVGGVDVRDLTARTLGRSVSLVPQDVYLFDGSVLDNIRFGSPGATEETILEAARRARVDLVAARLTGGWQARVGEAGSLLSGGERQRIAIARALLADAPIVLLDEPTSALDGENEAAIHQALAELRHNRTLLIVTHNLYSTRGADQIAVLGDGRIQERGTHDELLALDGRYAHMWEQQQQARGWRLTPAGRPEPRPPQLPTSLDRA